MKKILVIAAAALAFAACTKSEVFAPAAAEIDFTPNALTTKGLILPDGNSPDQTAFPTTESFNVFAFADLDDGNGYNYTTPLMNDVNISNQGDWKATPVLDPVTGDNTAIYLWPATGKVDFYAYHPESLNATFVSDEEPKGINLAGVSLGTAIGSQIDPLLATSLAQIAKDKPKVALVFKHIASQIAVTAFDATTTETLKGKISIEKVTFKNLHTSGDYTKSTTIGKGQWSNINTTADFVSFQGSEVLQETESYLSGASFTASIDNSAAFVVIPDNVVTGTAADQIIEVQYSIAAYTINGFDYPATPTQTVNIPIYNRVSANKFQNGKRYVFHLGISLDGANNEIMFSPMVEGWETEDISGITIDAVNATLL